MGEHEQRLLRLAKVLLAANKVRRGGQMLWRLCL